MMFPNPLNNPLIVKTVLSKAQEELNESLRFRKKQFQNPNLYMWVEIDEKLMIPFVCLKNESAENLVRLNAEELLNDKDIKEQLKKIPAIVRPFINFKKIVVNCFWRKKSFYSSDIFKKKTKKKGGKNIENKYI